MPYSCAVAGNWLMAADTTYSRRAGWIGIADSGNNRVLLWQRAEELAP